MRQAPKEEKRAPGPLHGDTIAQSFVFSNRGWRFLTGPRVRGPGLRGRRGRLMVADAVVPPSPSSNVFRNRGTRCTPGGGCAPCTPLGGRRRRRLLTWRVGTRFPIFSRAWGQGQRVAPAGGMGAPPRVGGLFKGFPNASASRPMLCSPTEREPAGCGRGPAQKGGPICCMRLVAQR